MPSIRVGAVNYLNSKPLVEGLTEFAGDLDLSLDLPSRLADQMAAHELEVGLIPVIEFLRAESYSFIPNIGITSHGPVLSVTLFSRVPWKDVRTVSLDEGSRTSAALTRILLEHRHRLTPQYRQLPIDEPAEAVSTDAVLLIGDRAMKACLPGFEFAYDLGHEWNEWTGLPMVFALWAVREGVDLASSEVAFAQAKQLGLRRAGVIATREAAALGLDAGFCRRYLTNIIRYDLGPRELAGLRRYHELAADLGAAPRGTNLVHYHRPHLVESRQR
ncbi:menaquinone biosynthetic enzyme MqnA/MqnD family protein [Limnoglobus roseus]|uniref:Chorismate dehydratase n=1 Tax=Limnoglobus roseus TaxID=2598579 RepID=A0A5C1AQ17_9BACT|nr:menaquinone biosynthesis protein [Limnoglobus roseus]QEL18958.1 Chorismate dehydratase [Limnoglobus roseus]